MNYRLRHICIININRIIFVAYFLIATSCTKVDYKYLAGFNQYMQNAFQISLDKVKNSVFYLIPLDGCDYCAIENMRSISFLKDQRLVPILIGKEKSKQVGEAKENLMAMNKNVLLDERSMVARYETGFFKPIVVHLRAGELVYYKYVTDDLITEVHDYLIEE